MGTAAQPAGWKIVRAAESCSSCGRGFEPGEEFFSRLHLESLSREDFCPGCWSAASPAGPSCFWKARRRESEESGPRLPTLDTLRTLLRRRLAGGRQGPLTYFLALLLLRKRAVRAPRGGGIGVGKPLSIRFPGEDQVHPILVPPARGLVLEEITQELRGILEETAEDEGA